MSVAAIIVAAGSSSRLGEPKQLILIDGEPLLQRAIRCATEAGASPVFVVLGAHRDLIENSIDFNKTKIVVNNEWEEGLSSSIRTGVKTAQAEAPTAEGLLLMTCDQPRVTAEHLHRLILMSYAQSAPTAIVSTYGGTRGIPAIFPRQAVCDLMGLHGDKGARALLAKPPWPVISIPLAGGEIDIDSPEDLEDLKS
ncbi:nucleotidyltransferase family protein [Telmatobacter sp. DSM 110680]|uniref:Nucleotidyltransferase family protein n=1 Tax=Telmatobacter sp. DSM 110680 TaxID=3036704 RepID=A0AAU7DPM4_9BACT